MSTPVKYTDHYAGNQTPRLRLDDGSFWPVLEGYPATEMFKVIPQAGHATEFMERLTSYRSYTKMRMNVFEMEGFLREMCTARSKVNETDKYGA